MLRFLLIKVKNQFLKLQRVIEAKKLYRFKKKLSKCGDDVHIEFPVKFEGIKNIRIGNNVSINAFVHIWGHGGVFIGNDSLIASHVSIISVTHDPKALKFKNSIIEKEVFIGNNVWIGSHCVILPGIKIGNNVIVGAGSIVTKDLAPNGTYVGSPARRVKELTQFT